MYYSVREVKAIDGHRLALRFEDGRSGVFDMGPFLGMPIFRPLRSVAPFS